MKFIFLISLIFSAFIHTSEQRNLAISLDFMHTDAEKSTGLSGAALYNLIKSETALILTNDVCWESFKLFINKRHQEEAEAIIKDINVYKNKDILLIVPNNYKNNFANLGINLKNFQSIKLNCKFEKSIIKTTKNYLLQLYYATFPYALTIKSNQFIQILQDLLISKKDIDNLEWNIFLIGHGLSIYTTGGITEDVFRKMLNLFEKHINTNAFFYESCFAGGKMKNFIYTQNDKKTKYSYPIFCKGVSDMPTFFCYDFNFKIFFEQLNKIKKDDPNTFNEFLKSTFEQNKIHPLNIVSVKYPNADFFTIPNIPNQIFTITQATQKEEFKNTLMCENIVINSPIIKNEINIANMGRRYIKFISASDGSYVHYIEKINALDMSYADLFKTFLNPGIQFLSSSKIILIKEINCAECIEDSNDKLVLTKKADSKKVTLKNVIIFLKSSTPWHAAANKDHEIFFITDEDPYIGHCSTLIGYSEKNMNEFYNIKTNKLTKKLTKQYLNFFEITKANLEKGIHRMSFNEKHFDNTRYRKFFPYAVTVGAIGNICLLFKLIF